MDELLKTKQGDAATAAELAGKAEEYLAAFYEAMDDDFNTALAISQLFALSKEINIYYQDVMNKGLDFDTKNFTKVAKTYSDMAAIIGLFEHTDAAADDSLADKLMDLIISIRQDARKEKNWGLADKIRDELKDAGVVLEDTPSGVRWKKA